MKKLKPIVATAFIVPFLFGCNKTQTVEKFTLTVVNGVGGGTYTKDEQITIVATVPANKTFKEWQVDSTKVSTENPYKVTVTKDVTYTAIFEDAPEENATITVVNGVGSGTYKKGEEITIVATVPSGKTFKEWQVDGTTVSSVNPYKVTVSNNITYTAIFQDAPQPGETATITVVNGVGGGTFAKGEKIAIVATIPSGKAFKEWKVNNESVSTENPYLVTVGDDITYTAVFKETPIPQGIATITTIDQFPGEGGSKTKTITCNKGEYINVPSPEHHDNYVLENWYVDKECTEVFNFNEQIVDDVTVYGKWIEASEQGLVFTPDNEENPNNYTVKASTENLPENIAIPSSHNGKPVVGITPWGEEDDGCFAYTKIKSISIPSTFTKIEKYAFYECYELRMVSLPNTVKSIEYESFYECYKLNAINFEEGLESIGYYALYGIGLSKVELPSTINNMEEGAFEWLPALETADLSKCSQLEELPDEAFGYCYGLKNFIFPIDSTMVNIGECAFYECYGLSKAHIPASVENISKNAFYYCYSLRELTFEENSSIETINDYAFAYCYGIREVVFPQGLNYIGENAFYCSFEYATTKLEFENKEDTYYVEYSSTTIKEYKPSDPKEISLLNLLNTKGATFYRNGKLDEETGYKYLKNGDSCVITENTDTTKTKITIPLTIKDGDQNLPVKKVMEYGTYIEDSTYLSGVTEVEFEVNEDGVNPYLKEIGKYAFYEFYYATKITNLDNCINLKTIGEGAFYYFGEDVEDTSAFTISLNFKDCTKLTTIGDLAFYYAIPLKSVVFPSSLIKLGNCSFEHDYYLETADFTRCTSLKNFGYYGNTSYYGEIFCYCESLEEIDLSNTMIGSITSYCFYQKTTSKTGKKGLKSIKLPETLGYIDKGVFTNCSNLEEITLPVDCHTCNENCFEGSSIKTLILDSHYSNNIYKYASYHKLFDKVTVVYVKEGIKVGSDFESAYTKSETSEKEGYEKWNKNAE